VRDADFEWDDAKAARNWRDHGVTFRSARAVFDDLCALDRPDDGQDETEDRFARSVRSKVGFCLWLTP
jgi:uncharacterized DUF497 family protein